MYEILYSLCYENLRSQLIIDTEYCRIFSKKRFNIIKLHELIRKSYNGPISIVSRDVLGNLVEYLCNILIIREEDYDLLPKYFEVLNHRYCILKELSFDLATESLRDACITKLLRYGKSN